MNKDVFTTAIKTGKIKIFKFFQLKLENIKCNFNRQKLITEKLQ